MTALVVVIVPVVKVVGAAGVVVKVVTASGEVGSLVPIAVIVETRNW